MSDDKTKANAATARSATKPRPNTTHASPVWAQRSWAPTISPPLLVDVGTTCFLTSLSRAKLYRLIRDGEFMQPVKLGTKSCFVLVEIQKWVEQRCAERDAV
jgi:predicted DNA-binding transcriptional regulator AlpA